MNTIDLITLFTAKARPVSQNSDIVVTFFSFLFPHLWAGHRYT